MARVFTLDSATKLALPGRSSREIVSGERGSSSVTLRKVEIPVVAQGDSPRNRHVHFDCEECIHVLSGTGITEADSGNYPLQAGDTILIPPGENHATRNTGTVPLVLLCFFPIADIRNSTKESGVPQKGDAKS